MNAIPIPTPTFTLTSMSKSGRYIIAIHEYSRASISYDFTCYIYTEKCDDNIKKIMLQFLFVF
jgi:hypothetical protein